MSPAEVEVPPGYVDSDEEIDEVPKSCCEKVADLCKGTFTKSKQS